MVASATAHDEALLVFGEDSSNSESGSKSQTFHVSAMLLMENTSLILTGVHAKLSREQVEQQLQALVAVPTLTIKVVLIFAILMMMMMMMMLTMATMLRLQSIHRIAGHAYAAATPTAAADSRMVFVVFDDWENANLVAAAIRSSVAGKSVMDHSLVSCLFRLLVCITCTDRII